MVKAKNKLWTRNFTIITIGSLVSYLGNSISGFAMGLLVFNKTDSTLLLALVAIVSTLPGIVVPSIAGTFLDRVSRKKAIYLLDFLSATLFVGVALLTYLDLYNFFLYLGISFIFGIIGSFYNVAYESFYPTLISKGSFSKAYAISSLLWPIATTVTIPIAAIIYTELGMKGLALLFLFNSVTFFIAAIFEASIKVVEDHLIKVNPPIPPTDISSVPDGSLAEANTVSNIDGDTNPSQQLITKPIKAKKKPAKKTSWAQDFKIGISYISKEKGLMAIMLYFFFTMMFGAALSNLMLPFFERSAVFTTTDYSFVLIASTIGRVVGAIIHYLFKLPPSKKIYIAITVYFTISVLDMFVLYMPLLSLFFVFQFLVGLFSVTSFNIRISGTQHYVPNKVRGRFNGVFALVLAVGTIIGQLISGVLGDIIPIPYIVSGAMVLNLIAIITIVIPRRNDIKQIYNCDL